MDVIAKKLHSMNVSLLVSQVETIISHVNNGKTAEQIVELIKDRGSVDSAQSSKAQRLAPLFKFDDWFTEYYPSSKSPVCTYVAWGSGSGSDVCGRPADCVSTGPVEFLRCTGHKSNKSRRISTFIKSRSEDKAKPKQIPVKGETSLPPKRLITLDSDVALTTDDNIPVLEYDGYWFPQAEMYQHIVFRRNKSGGLVAIGYLSDQVEINSDVQVDSDEILPLAEKKMYFDWVKSKGVEIE